MDRRRLIPTLGAVFSGLTMLGMGWVMANRVVAHNREAKRVVYAFDTRSDTEFTFAGRPVTLSTDRSDPVNTMLVVRYGDQQLRLRAAIPGSHHLPGLIQHEDWMRLMRFGVMSGRTIEEFKRDLGTPALPDRLAVVTRIPRPGSDPGSWGQVWIKDWTFEFHEFLPEGGFKSERYGYPTHRRGQKPKEGELKDNTWEFQAALQLMPQQARERLMGKYDTDAMHQLGWALPIGGFCGAACIFFIGFAAAPRRTTKA
ncbi:MAG: hypothetical protein ACOYPS_14190 [Phycisphaerales bacterium]